MEKPLSAHAILPLPLVSLIMLYACAMPITSDQSIPVNMDVAIQSADAIGIRKIIEKNPNSVNAQNNVVGWTPLHFALIQDYESSIDIVRILLKAGADPNLYDSEGNTALHESVIKLGRESLSDETYTEIVKVLLEYGANVHARNMYGVTPLHMATVTGANTTTISILLGHGANVNAKAKVGGWTPLHGASSKDRLDIVKTLLEKKADKTIKDDQGRTPFDVAKQLGYLDVAKELGDHAISETEISAPTVKQEQLVEAKPSVTKSLKRFTNSIGMEFVLIPAGRFKMGGGISPEEVARRYGGNATYLKCEHPQHPVEITKSFYLQTTEITQEQWQKVMGNNPSRFKGCGDDCPVEQVSWVDTQEFIKKLNDMEGTDTYRLPTEAEWESAARAGTTTEFSFGDDAGQLGAYAWFIKNFDSKMHSVGSKKPNAWGLYDMHGSVWEWVEDDWHGTYNEASSDGRAWIDEPRGTLRVVRGGSGGSDAHLCRSAGRGGDWPGGRRPGIGFRLARSVALGP